MEDEDEVSVLSCLHSTVAALTDMSMQGEPCACLQADYRVQGGPEQAGRTPQEHAGKQTAEVSLETGDSSHLVHFHKMVKGAEGNAGFHTCQALC